MPLAVFLRGANVGGARTFRPAEVARDLDAVNIGAAGTFVVKRRASAATVRREFAKALPFVTEIIVVPAEDLAELARRDPFRRLPAGAKPVVTFLARKPAALPPLPFDRPEGVKWEVRVLEISPPFALACYRVFGKLGLYPNEVVEKSLGVPATTRGWPTILKVVEVAGRS